MTLKLVEGRTVPIEFQVLLDGAEYDLTDCSIAMMAYKVGGTSAGFTGTVSVSEAATGKLMFYPALADLKASDYHYDVRFKITRGDGKVDYFPSEGAMAWIVSK